VLVSMDERCGRSETRGQGLPISGTAAVLVLVMEYNLILAWGPLLVAMRDEGRRIKAEERVRPKKPKKETSYLAETSSDAEGIEACS
jgi:hypothetical protein